MISSPHYSKNIKQERKASHTLDLQCAGACYMHDQVWNTVTWLTNFALPLIMIMSSNILLVAHTLYQKNKIKRKQFWSKNVKMIVQLVVVTLLYCLFWFPNVILQILVRFVSTQDTFPPITIAFQQAILLVSLTPIFYPFVCLAGLPLELAKIKCIMGRNRDIRVQALPMAAVRIHQQPIQAFTVARINQQTL